MIIFFKVLKLFLFYLYMIWNGHNFDDPKNFKQVWKCCEDIVRGLK